jgi:hypothetical protein
LNSTPVTSFLHQNGEFNRQHELRRIADGVMVQPVLFIGRTAVIVSFDGKGKTSMGAA